VFPIENIHHLDLHVLPDQWSGGGPLANPFFFDYNFKVLLKMSSHSRTRGSSSRRICRHLSGGKAKFLRLKQVYREGFSRVVFERPLMKCAELLEHVSIINGSARASTIAYGTKTRRIKGLPKVKRPRTWIFRFPNLSARRSAVSRGHVGSFALVAGVANAA
jgi:hypothetical protein